MNGRIGHLHLRYRVVAPGGPSSTMPPTIGRAHLAAVVSRALDDVLGEDEAVVVIRSTRVHLAFSASTRALDRRIADGLAAQVVDEIARAVNTPDDGDGIARFDNQPHFVASFIGALVRGWAWDRWFFSAFQPYRHSNVSATILAVLHANRGELCRILAYLRRADTLEAVLASLGSLGQSAVHDIAPSPIVESASFRPLANAAFRIAEALGWWVRDAAGEWRFFHEFLATEPLQPNWQDPTSLSATVLAMVRRLRRTEAPPPGIARVHGERLHAFLAGELEWLDRSWIAAEIASLEDTPRPPPILSPGHASRATPHQRDLLARIRELVERGTCVLDRSAPTSVANVLRVLAALADQWPEQKVDDSTRSLIEHVLGAWALLERPTETQEPSDDSRDQLTLVQGLGPAAQELLNSLAKQAGARDTARSGGNETRAAGVFLLARPVLDLGLPYLARQAGVPLSGLLAGVAASIFGSSALWGDRIDPGVAVWAALDTEMTAAEVSATISRTSSNSLHRLQLALLGRLVGQRHIDPGAAAIASVAVGNGHWWVATDRKGLCWPLAVEDNPSSGFSTAQLVQAWAEATGEVPQLVPGERDSASDIATVLGTPIVPESLAISLAAVTSSILRAWARWIPGVGDSSLPFLLRNCIHRAGRVSLTKKTVDVQLDPAPLDVVLEMAGYLRPLPNLGWLGGRDLQLTVQQRRLDG